MNRPWLAALALVTCATTTPAMSAPATAPSEGLRLEYSAPDACPGAEAFAVQLRDRTSRVRFAEPGELARTFVVSLRAEPPGYTGSVEFLDDTGESVSRRVHGERCEAVVSSLALITALALDATLRVEEAEAVPAEPAPPAVPVASEAPVVSAVPAPRPAPAPALAPAVKERSLEGARVGLLGGYGSALGGARAGLLAELDWKTGLALRLSAHYDWHEAALDEGRSARLRQQGLELSVCRRRWRLSVLAIAPCAAVDFGSLRAEGVRSDRLTSVRADVIWWSALALQLGVAYEPPVPVWVELQLAAQVPLRAGYRFIFDSPRGVAYEVPFLAGSGALAAGVRFW